MGKYKQAIITNGGQNLIAEAVSGGGTIMFTSVKTSSYSYPEGTNIAGLTDLQDIKQDVKPSAAGVFNETMIQISATIENSSVTEDYLIQTIGVYAQIDEGDIHLFAVIQATTPDQMPEQSDISPSSFIYNIQMTVQQASSVSVSVDPAGTASVEDINNLQTQINQSKEDIIKIKTSITEIKSLIEVALPASGWSGSSFPYTQTVTVEGFTDEDEPTLVMIISNTAPEADVKAYKKAFGLIFAGEVSESGATFYASKKPETDITVGLKGR